MIDDVTVVEGSGGTTNAFFTVRLSAPTGQTVTVNFATANGTATAGGDYAFTSGLATFPPLVTTAPISVAIATDTLDEANETFFVNLTNAANAFIADAQGRGTITDDDPQPSIAIDDVVVSEGDSGISSPPDSRSSSPRPAGKRYPSTTPPPTARRPRDPTTRRSRPRRRSPSARPRRRSR
jgi:hypothetical protein